MAGYKMSENEPPRYTGKVFADLSKSDGGLKHTVGVSSYQILRANRNHPELADDAGYTYNHAPDMTYRFGYFWVQYLSNPKDEHEPGGISFIARSKDGIAWEKPTVSFPKVLLPHGENICKDGAVIRIPENTYAVMHQRTAFYTAPNGRLLTTGFYGYSPDHAVPWENNGLGRVVREVYRDGTLGPIYFIYIMRSSGWNEASLPYPEYGKSEDSGLIDACNALLKDKFETQQWAEEHGNDCEYVALKTHCEVYGRSDNKPYQAFTRYHINKDTVVALWKHGITGISFDNGENWLIKKEPSFVTTGAKAWGEKTSDGKFALFYINSISSEHRYPLVSVTSENGIEFVDIAAVFGEVPPRRYEGLNKDYGPQYIRGICEENAEKPSDAVWLTYSVNKEDIWVSRIPVPVKSEADEFFGGNFESNRYLEPWNIYSSKWAKAENVGTAMVITDKDPSDYAIAELNFPECEKFRADIELQCSRYDSALEIELADSNGIVCERFYIEKGRVFGRNTSIKQYIHDFDENKHTLSFEQDCVLCETEVFIDGEKAGKIRNIQKVNSVSRLIFRTKPHRSAPGTDVRPIIPDIENCDLPTEERKYTVFSVFTAKIT